VSNPSALAAIEYEAETAFGEDVTTFATHRIPHRGKVDASGLTHDKVDPERVVQYRNDGTQWILMTQGGLFKTLMDLPGHGTTTAGSPTLDPIEVFLGYVFGNVALSSAASTTATAGTATVPVTAASGTFSAGGLCVIGALNDGRGNGQMYPIATHVTTNLTLLAAMDAAPSAADVIYPVAQIYTSEIPTNAGLTGSAHPTPAPGLRFRLMTANLRYECHGCYPTAVSLTGFSAKGRPQIEVTWAVSWWRYSTATFPSVVASNQYNPAGIAAGSVFLNDFGTATRVKRSVRNFNVDYTMGMVDLPGPGGANQFQTCVGCRRTVDICKVSWMEDADANTLTPVLPGKGTAQVFQHLMYTGSTAIGSRIGMYFRRLAITNVALQKDDNGINRLAVEAEAQVSPTTTSDLTLSSFCLGFA
jgi:hypothetical protein